MRYGREYDRGYAGGRGRSPMGDVGRGPETNWMGRNYRTPGPPPRGYDASFGRGYRPHHGGWEVQRGGRGYDRGYAAGGYDRPYRPLGRVQHGYEARGGYDRGYRAGGGRGRGGILHDPWGPYGEQRMIQERSADWYDRPWPNRYFTDHGHQVG